MATTLHQQHHIDCSDVITMTTRDIPRDVPRDVMNRELKMNHVDDLLLMSFYDVTDTSQLDAWMMTSPLMTSSAADDSGVSLNQSVNNDDEWSPWIPPDNDVIVDHVTMESTTSPGNPCSDGFYAFKHVNEEIPGVMLSSCRPMWSTGNGGDDVMSQVSFTYDQITCICVALQQKRDFDKLDAFLATLASDSDRRSSLQPCIVCRRQTTPSSREIYENDVFPVTHCHRSTCVVQQSQSDGDRRDVVDAVLSSVAHVAFERGRYEQVYGVLRSHTFSDVHHAGLQKLWYDAHYAEAAALRRRPLNAVDKYRIRRKHALPSTIWDGQDTVYCFKVSQRHLCMCLAFAL